MKSIKEMSKDELLIYCTQLKMNGSNYRELAAIFEKHDVDSEDRRFVISRLDSLDKKQKREKEESEYLGSLGDSIKNLVIGIVLIVFSIVLYKITSKSGVIFVLNLVLIVVGGLMTIRGIIGLIKSQLRSKEKV